VREYVQWTVDNYGAPEIERRIVPSPFSLPAAIDYLDVVWQLRFGKPLVRLKGAERTAQLAYDAGTADEFYGRMSALGETLARFDIDVSRELVRAEDGALDRMPRRMRALLHDQLSDEHRSRVDDATGRLNAAAALRHGGQHADAAARAGESHATLGLKYPIASYQEAWQAISNVVAMALNDIREEIQSEGAQGTDE
jgi:hypothetical protein